MIEFNTVEVLNAVKSFHKFGKWIGKDPDFPDTILSGNISPTSMLKCSKHPTTV